MLLIQWSFETGCDLAPCVLLPPHNVQRLPLDLLILGMLTFIFPSFADFSRSLRGTTAEGNCYEKQVEGVDGEVSEQS